ncbi:MAG: flavin monoamine oxidase family protein [Planktomarina sp.]
MKPLIVGGGLSGLALAEAMQRRGMDYELVEARNRFGGRIKTQVVGDATFDLGPAWFWPGQPRIAALIDRLCLRKFDQHTDGAFVIEDQNGQVQHGRGFASMQKSWRLKRGLSALNNALADRLPADRKHLQAQVTAVTKTAAGIQATLHDGRILTADKIIFAMPPRVISTMNFTPALPDLAIKAMQGVPTWMAGQAKAVAVYDTPFWREAGLSGDATSRHGPMVEVHDASPMNAGLYALFGFIGVPPHGRQDQATLRHHLIAQLVRLFGPMAETPKQLFVKDWAFDPFTSTDLDHRPLYAHPTYNMPIQLANLWDGSITFAGTEVAPQFGGYLEGALEAAENAMNALTG